MTTTQRIDALEKRIVALAEIAAAKPVTFKNEQPFKGQITRGATGKLGYEITMYADSPAALTELITKIKPQFDVACGIAPDEATLTPTGSSVPYNAGQGRE